MNIRKTLWGIMVCVAALAALTLTSCSLTGATSEQARIGMFKDALNSGTVTDIMANFSSSMTQYSQMNTQSYWDGTPFAKADGPFTITTSGTVTSDTTYSSDGTTESETITNGSGNTYNVQFWFTNPTNDNWIIRAFQYVGTSGTILLHNIH